MTIQLGNIDLMKEITELWFELVKTQAILETVVNKNKKENILSESELRQCEDKAFTAVKNRFPSLSIKRR